MHKNEYRAAMGKISVSDAWRAETLAKMQAACSNPTAVVQAEPCDAAADSKAAQPVAVAAAPHARKGALHFPRRWALGLAAAAAVIVLPLLALNGGLFATKTTGTPDTVGGEPSYFAANSFAGAAEITAQDAADAAPEAAEESAGASQPAESGQTLRGTVESAGEASLTLQTEAGTQTFTLTAQTRWGSGLSLESAAGTEVVLTLAQAGQGENAAPTVLSIERAAA